MLQTLYCWETGVSDITALGNCKHLELIDLRKTEVTSIRALLGRIQIDTIYCLPGQITYLILLAETFPNVIIDFTS